MRIFYEESAAYALLGLCVAVGYGGLLYALLRFLEFGRLRIVNGLYRAAYAVHYNDRRGSFDFLLLLSFALRGLLRSGAGG